MRYKMGMLLAAGVLLTGCASGAPSSAETPTAEPTPTVEASANQEACDAFAQATSTMATRLNSDQNANDAWESVRVDVDSAGLIAEGDVKERISALVDEWPSVSDIVIYPDGREEMNKRIDDISRACEADGAGVDVYLFQTD